MRTTVRLLGLLAVVFAVTLTATPTTEAAVPLCSAVQISGPSNVYAETSCVSPVWSAACGCPNGATPSYGWTIGGGGSLSTGPSVSKTYCPTTPAQTSTVQVAVTIRCGRTLYTPPAKSVFVSQCDDTTSPPTCNG
jgi:hypothetical protein